MCLPSSFWRNVSHFCASSLTQVKCCTPTIALQAMDWWACSCWPTCGSVTLCWSLWSTTLKNSPSTSLSSPHTHYGETHTTLFTLPLLHIMAPEQEIAGAGKGTFLCFVSGQFEYFMLLCKNVQEIVDALVVLEWKVVFTLPFYSKVSPSSVLLLPWQKIVLQRMIVR